jgi:hypothetical protein
MAAELERIGTVVGKEGKIAQRATIGNAEGSWGASVNSVNTLITDLVQPTSETARVIRAVAKGDLSQTIALEIERPSTLSKPPHYPISNKNLFNLYITIHSSFQTYFTNL